MISQSIATPTCVVRNTDRQAGRTRSVLPGATAARHLHYGRIILAAGDLPIRFTTNDLETGLIVLKGDARVSVDGVAFTLARYDGLYAPRDAAIEVKPGAGGCDIAEVAAPVTRRHPVQHVPYAEVQKNPGLHFEAGGPAAKRELNVVFGKNIQAGRIMAGVTFSQPGNWTSWPPHEHAALAEEAYLYIEMPPPSFGILGRMKKVSRSSAEWNDRKTRWEAGSRYFAGAKVSW